MTIYTTIPKKRCLLMLIILGAGAVIMNACATEKQNVCESSDTFGRQDRKASPGAAEEKPTMKQERNAGAFQNIYFDYDSFCLKPVATRALQKTAEWLRKNKSIEIRIGGHCDERGTSEYNLSLGQRRADIARRFLLSTGIDEDRIVTISYGEEVPAVPGHNEKAWSKNRRDEFVIIKTKDISGE